MARTLSQSDTPLRISLVLLAIGAILGVAHFLLSIMLTRYVVDPLSCGVAGSAAQCGSSTVIADSIATILVTTGAIFLGIRYGVMRPVLVAVATGLFMWGLMTWTDGLFWLEAAGWAILLYAISYAVFGWINRYPVIGYPLIVIIVGFVIERITLAL